MSVELEEPRLSVAIVAPMLEILGGQAVQAQRLLDAWTNDRDIHAWLVSINPTRPRWLRGAMRVRYLRTVLTQLMYYRLLARALKRTDHLKRSPVARTTLQAVDVNVVPSREHVARNVCRLLEEPELARRIILAGSAVADGLAWPRVRDQWVAVYRELAAGRVADAAAVRPV
jgi:hypothetical protein